MSEAREVPTNWAEMLELLPSERAGSEEFIQDCAASLAKAKPGSFNSDFFSPAEPLAELAVGFGPQSVRPLFALFEQPLQAELKVRAAGTKEPLLVTTLGVLHYVAVARCCDGALPREAIAIEKDWLPFLASRKGDMEEKESYSMAFAALALGAFERVPGFIGGGPLPASVEPGQKFQLNVQKFVRYMAAAAARGMKAEEVAPAFREFVLVFPLKVGAKSLQWIDLMHAARAYYVHFERRPVETVAQTLHELVTSIAAGK
jgi:hypothetical protein